MVYSNLSFNIAKLFRAIRVTDISAPLTKKKKNIDKKNLKAPYGSIISLQHGNELRGLDMRKKKKHWCAPNCQLEEKIGEKKKKILTVVEEIEQIPDTDVYQIKYFCTNCNNYFTHRELKKLPAFLNQISLYLSIGDINLNIMLFKDNFKISGCKENNDAAEATMILWENYILHSKGMWGFKKYCKCSADYEAPCGRHVKLRKSTSLPTGSGRSKRIPDFVIDLVMRNVDFKLGFNIDRERLLDLMNEEKYADTVSLCQYEPTSHSNVKVKMYSKKPDDYDYDFLQIPKKGRPRFVNYKVNPYLKKKLIDKPMTFIIFSSSEVILSGRYEDEMRRTYDFFVKEMMDNKDRIIEKIDRPKENLGVYLQKTKNKSRASKKTILE